MIKNLKEGPVSVIKQNILLPLPSKRYLKLLPETKVFIKTSAKRILIEDEERAALRYNVMTREFEFFPGSHLTYRPGCPKSSLLGMKNTILRYAGLKLRKEESGKEVNRAHKSHEFVALEADAKLPAHVTPTIVDPRRIRTNLPTNVEEARACLIAHFACQCIPIDQKPFASICEKHVVPNREEEWKEYQDFLTEVLGSLQTLDRLIVQGEVYFVQRKLAEMIVPDKALGTTCGLPAHKSDLNGGQKPCLSLEELTMGRAPFQNAQNTAEGSSDTSAPTTAARTVASSNQEDLETWESRDHSSSPKEIEGGKPPP
jgi:hypothetical protein